MRWSVDKDKYNQARNFDWLDCSIYFDMTLRATLIINWKTLGLKLSNTEELKNNYINLY